MFNFSFLPLLKGKLMLCALPQSEADFLTIKQHAIKLISLTETPVKTSLVAVVHLPTVDYTAPLRAEWQKISDNIHQALHRDKTIAIHCHAGLGRTGTLAAMILIEQGMAATQAIAHVRQYRQGAIESIVQEEFLFTYKAKF